MLGSWRLVARRMRDQRVVVGAAFATVLLAATLLSLVSLYTGSVARAGVTQVLRTAGDEAVVQVTVGPGGDRLPALDAAVRADVATSYGTVGSVAYLSGQTVSQTLVGRRQGGAEELAVIGFYDGLPQHARLLEGAWPATAEAGPVPAVLPAGAASALGLAPGRTVLLADRVTGRRTQVLLTGTYAATDAADPYWGGSLETKGVEQGDFRTYGPFVVDRGIFAARFATPGSSLRWRVALDPASVQPADVPRLRDAVSRTAVRLRDASTPATSGLADASVTTGLPALLDRVDSSTLASGSTILLPVLDLVLLAAAGLLLTGRLLGEDRRVETALVRARGASVRQTAEWSLREAALVVLPAALLAPLVGSLLLGTLAGSSAFRRTGIRLPTSPAASAWAASAVAAVLCALALLVPLLGQPRTYVESRQALGRQGSRSAVQRAGGDVALLVLAVLAYLQLRRYAAPVNTDLPGRLRVDPVLVGAPVLLLLGGAVLALRLLPLVARTADWVATPRRRLVGALAAWQVGRGSARYSGPALLLVLSTATGVLATGYAASLARSQRDTAAFRVGADLRVRLPAAVAVGRPLGLSSEFSALPAVETALPVVRDGLQVAAATGTALLLDARQAGRVMALRPDLATTPAGPLLARASGQRPSPRTVALPEGTRRVLLTMSVGGTYDVEQVAVSLALRNAAGEVVVIPAGTLAADARDHDLSVDLRSASAERSRTSAPQRVGVLGVDVRYPVRGGGRASLSVSLRRVAAQTGNARPTVLPPVEWRPLVPPMRDSSVATSAGVPAHGVGGVTVPASSSATEDGLARIVFAADDSLARVPASVPAVVSDGFARVASDATGAAPTDGTPGSAALPARIGALDLRLTPVGRLREIPTLQPGEPGVVLDLPTVALLRYALLGDATAGQEEWLRTNGPGTAAALASRPDLAESVADREATVRSLRDDPLTVGGVGALAIGFLAAAGFAAIGFAVSAAVAARARLPELAVLRALGLSGRQLAALLLAEQALLVVLGILPGVVLGAVLAGLVLPLVLLTPDGSRPVPAVLVDIPWVRVALLVGAVVAVLLLVCTVIALRVGRARPSEELRRGEEA